MPRPERPRAPGRRAGGRQRSREPLVERLDRHVDRSSQGVDEPRRLVGLLAVLAAQRQRQPDDDQLRLLGRDEPRELAQPASLAARSTTTSGRASVPVASETATPVRAAP